MGAINRTTYGGGADSHHYDSNAKPIRYTIGDDEEGGGTSSKKHKMR